VCGRAQIALAVLIPYAHSGRERPRDAEAVVAGVHPDAGVL
jgi:hypothetical protein